jgi:aspartate/methionine/tyrosine aminotransferase
MKVKIHKLFSYLLDTTEAKPDAILGFSLASSPRLGEFMDELDPELSLDWSNQSFQGLPALRMHVIERAGLTGQCSIDDVLITAGAAEANFLALMQLVQPGDELIIDMPGWPQPVVLGEAIGANIKLLTRHEEDSWRFSLDELAELVTERTRLIFLCNPNNPTGQILREAELREVIRLAEQVGAYLLCDEVYAGLEWVGARIPSVAGLYQRGISTGSVSKTLGLQGLRIGWLISRDPEVISDAVVLRENTSEIMNVLGEMVAEIALRHERYERSLHVARMEGQSNLDMLDEFIASRTELSWQRPQAGLIGLCRLHMAIDGEQLASRLLRPPYRTFVIPGSAFGCPQHIRLGVGGGKASGLETGLARLTQFLDDQWR